MGLEHADEVDDVIESINAAQAAAGRETTITTPKEEDND